MIDQQTQLHDIYDIVYQPFWQASWFVLLVACLIGIIFVGVVMFILKKRQRHATVAYWQHVQQDLDGLKFYCVAGALDYQRFYQELTAIIKKYLGLRYQHELIGKTDHEVIEYLGTIAFPINLHQIIKDIVQHAVAVKFARQDAALKMMQQDLNNSQFIVQQTIVHEESIN